MVMLKSKDQEHARRVMNHTMVVTPEESGLERKIFYVDFGKIGRPNVLLDLGDDDGEAV